ncbi:MAG: hypothetical protein LUC85_05840 [Bacteroidales bacterium]|nr:hypothetical protein [Bacteroidales bacterium]MCC8175560.1 hypothetical protein [Bacteroidales bacterium]MCD8394338.1 hypothetical protein [Bacteroidales bacterium]
MKASDSKSSMGGVARTIFGIIMIAIYVGMGVLMIINFFQWNPQWDWARWLLAAVFIVYGVWRAYRQFAGIDSRV